MKKPTQPEIFAQCPVEKTLQILGKKHTTLIIRDLLTGTKRFGEIQKNMPFVSTKTLTERLKFLVDEGIVDRKAYDTVPLKVEYSLTQLGLELNPIIEQMRIFGKKINQQEGS